MHSKIKQVRIFEFSAEPTMPAFAESADQYSCKLCSHGGLQRTEVASHLERKHSVITRDWNFMLTLMNSASRSTVPRSDVENNPNARVASRSKQKNRGGRQVVPLPKSGTRFDGEDDFDNDWAPGKKKQSFRKVGQHFKCEACSRMFKREGQFDRHRCFGTEDGPYSNSSSRGASNRSPSEPDFKRNRAETYQSMGKPVAQTYKRIVDAKTNCLEEGTYFFRMKKDLDSVQVDVDAKTNKVEVQVSIEGDSEEIVREMYQCKECSSVLPSREEASCHVKGHLPTHHFCCKFCPDRWRFTNDFLGSVLKHVRSSHPGKVDLTRCVRCGFTSTNTAVMDEHMVKRHPPLTNYSCTHCSAEFGLSILGLVNHVKIEHADDSALLENVVTEAKTVFDSEDIFECNLCEKVFFTKAHIEAHKEVHASGDVDITDDDIAGILRCCHCKYESLNVEELRMHIDATHKHLYCKICDAHIFSGQCFSESLINHILISHDVKNDADTNLYVKQLTTEAYKYYCVNSSFNCKICPKIFFSRRAFADHMRSHESGVVTQFTCEACGQHLKSKQALLKHIKKHKFLYFSPESAQFFTSNQSLQEHLIGCHSESDDLPCEAYKRSLVVSLFLPHDGISQSVPLIYANNDLLIDYYKGKHSNLGGDRFEFPRYVHNSLNRSTVENDEKPEDEGYESPMEPIDPSFESAQNAEGGGGGGGGADGNEHCQGTTILLVTGEEGHQEQIAIELPPGTDGAQTLRELGLSVDAINLPTGGGGTVGNTEISDGRLELCLDSPFVIVPNTEFCLALAQLKFCWMTEETLAALMKCYGDMECLYCGKFFHSNEKFAAHQTTHMDMPQYKCTQCDYFCHHFQFLKQHLDRSHGAENLQCNECEFAATSKLKFAQHMKKHTPGPLYKCSKCGETCETSNRMREHFNVKHPSLTIDEASLQQGNRRKVGSNLKIEPCKYCGKVFEANALEKHLWLHEDVNPYKCDICDYQARSKTYLTLHRQSHDVSGNVHSCKVCQMPHKSEKMLINHVVSTHFDNNTCPQCGHAAANRGDFHCHLLIHSEKKSFACNICPTVLLQENKMEEHFRTKHYGARVQYTSFINENPISIQDIADMVRNPPENQAGHQVDQSAASSAVQPESGGQLGAGVAYDSAQLIDPNTGLLQQPQDMGNQAQFAMEGGTEGTSEQPSEETMEAVNAAIKALIDSGHNIPEGAEIVIDNNTIVIDGVPTAVITTEDPSEQLAEQQQQQQEQPQAQVVDQTLQDQQQQQSTQGLEQQTHEMLESMQQQQQQQELVYDQSQAVEEMDQVLAGDSSQQDLMQLGDDQSGGVVSMPQEESAPAGEAVHPAEEGDGAEYISLDNLDLASLNLPPGNYNIVIDEHGQTVIVPTDTIDENTIQVIAQE